MNIGNFLIGHGKFAERSPVYILFSSQKHSGRVYGLQFIQGHTDCINQKDAVFHWLGVHSKSWLY